MTPREEADRIVLLLDVLRWTALRDEIEAALIAAEDRGYDRGRGDVINYLPPPGHPDDIARVKFVRGAFEANNRAAALAKDIEDIVAVSPGLSCDGDVDL